MKKCSCCRQSWPMSCFRRTFLQGRTYRHPRCYACEENCGLIRKRRAVARSREWRARLRADVEAVRAARAG